jgi:hypothetical protein
LLVHGLTLELLPQTVGCKDILWLVGSFRMIQWMLHLRSKGSIFTQCTG